MRKQIEHKKEYAIGRLETNSNLKMMQTILELLEECNLRNSFLLLSLIPFITLPMTLFIRSKV